MTTPAGRPLRVCILSRKDLARITRVTRQARALSEAGAEVTVVSLGQPLDAHTAPDVQFVEVELDPRTRRYAALGRRIASGARLRGGLITSLARLVLLVLFGVVHLLLLIPNAILLRRPGEKFWPLVRGLARHPLRVPDAYVRILLQHANTVSFAEQACLALTGRGFDYCQAHDSYALVAAERLAKQSGASVAYDAVEISEHRQGQAGGRSFAARLVFWRERRIEERILRRASFTITVGEKLADWYAERYGIPRPVPVRNARYFWEYERREDIRADCGAGPADRLVVWFGGIYPDQGLDALVEAASLLPRDVHFALLGGVQPAWEPFVRSLQDDVAGRGLEQRIHLLPQRDPDDLVPYASGADLGIIPLRPATLNIRYCMPNKLLEMVMARLPVVATRDLEEVRAVIEQYGVGETFDVDSPQDVARALGHALDPSVHEHYREAVLAAAHELCWENESRKYLALFGEGRLRAQPDAQPLYDATSA